MAGKDFQRPRSGCTHSKNPSTLCGMGESAGVNMQNSSLDNPFDEGIKGIATFFAELLRGIVKTIDRWGLKSLFLRKHLVDVARFYRRISNSAHLSAAASKWKARLEKERDKLFIFLSHDGVPWNN